MSIKLTGMTILMVFAGFYVHAQEDSEPNKNHRTLTMSRQSTVTLKANKSLLKEIKAANKTAVQDKQSAYTLLSKDFYYIAGKPTWSYPYDKIIHKPLANISPKDKNGTSFKKRLFTIKETPFQADIEARIYFQSGEHTLASRNKIQFDNLLRVIHETLSKHQEQHPNEDFYVWISIKGFTDPQPFYANQPTQEREKSNLNLSKQRAKQLEIYLKLELKQKVKYLKIESEGWGEALPPHISPIQIEDAHRRLCLVMVHFYPVNQEDMHQQDKDLSIIPGR